MNSLRLTPDQTVYYSYAPSSDTLLIRLEPESRRTVEEALPDLPLVHLSRDASSGAVVGLSVSGVQELLLQTLVRSLVEQTQGYWGTASLLPITVSDDSELELEEGEAVEELLAAEEEAGAEGNRISRSARRRNRRRRKRAQGFAPDGTPLSLAEAAESAGVEESEETIPSPAEVEAEALRAMEAASLTEEDTPPLATAPMEAPSEAAAVAPTDPLTPPEAEVTPAPKRGRGRKKAVEPEPVVAEEPVPTVVEAVAPEVAVPPKRGRGRKKTVEAEAEIVSGVVAPEAALAEAAPAPKRGRGRKKAVEPVPEEGVEPTPAEATAESVVEDAKPKRGRGRKKSAEAEAVAVEVSVEEAPVKPKRGRKKAAEALLTPETTQEETSSKPKRGRGRKKAPQAPELTEEPAVTLEALEPELLPRGLTLDDGVELSGDELTGELADFSEGEGEERPGRSSRRRNRRRKGKGEAEGVAPTLAPIVQAEEAAPETEEEKAAKRKRRRRKKRGKGASESATATATPMTAPTPPAAPVPKPAPRRRDEEEGEEEPPRRSYKTAPIPGLDAPDAFAFMKLDPLLGQAIAAMGFEEPTPIQRRAVPEALKGLDLIGLAQTGTGKTMAFLMPGLQRIVAGKAKDHKTRMLVLTPTRELALQVSEEAEYLATHTEIRITTVYGGVGFKQQTSELKAGADVIVATPGRLLDHLKRGTMRLDSVEVLVLDEADRMLDMGFLPEIRSILRQLPTKRQTLLFSATMPTAIQTLSMDFQEDPVLVEVARQLPPETLDQRLYPVEKHLKLPLLVHLLQTDAAMRSVLVFTETKSEADVVARKLQEAGLPVALMHGDRNQREREEALQKLRSGAVRVLVATNVAARGLDIYDISHVINYDVPQTVDDYVHRIGRTARGEAEGKAYTLATSGDVGMIMRIESALEKSLPRERAGNFNYEVPTPSWAKPSAEELLDTLHKPKGLADRFSKMLRRR